MGAAPCGAPCVASGPTYRKPLPPTAQAGAAGDTKLGGRWHEQFVLSEASRALHGAVASGDYWLATKYLDRSLARPDCCDATGVTPLHAATGAGRADLVHLLLEHAATTSAPGGPLFDGPPVALAARRGYASCLAALLQARASPAAQCGTQRLTCLHFAAAEGHADCLQMLLAADFATVKVTGRGGVEHTLLEHSDLVANFQDARNRLPLHAAAETGKTACVAILIAQGYSMLDFQDATNSTALHLGVLAADEQAAFDICQLIGSAKGNVNLQDDAHLTPLHLVAARGRARVCSLLLNFSADTHICEGAYGRTALHEAARVGAADACGLILAARADPFAQDEDGRTALMQSNERACVSLLSEFMRQGEREGYRLSA